ncbi:MAG: DUF5050 domain-containing protein [Clostridia bacterium]
MKKFSKIFLVAIVTVIISATLFGCQSFKWGPVGTNNPDAEVINNGSPVVQQGEYIYFVNGKADATSIKKPSDNYFGKAAVKGSILKAKIAADGSLSETAVVVPKMYMSNNANTGLYVFKDWIYYSSPSTSTNNKDEVLTTQLEFFRTKTDGTTTQKIATLEDDKAQFIFTETAFIYFEKNTLNKVSYTEKKIGKKTEIAKDITTVLFTKQSSDIFFVKADEDKAISSTNIFVIHGDSAIETVFDSKTYATAEKPTLAEQKTITISSYDRVHKVLYYTKKNNSGDAKTGTYGYQFVDNNFKVDRAKEKKFANASITTVYGLGFEDGFINIADANGLVYKPMADDVNENVSNKDTKLNFSAQPTILFQENDFLYYLINNKLKRLNYKAVGTARIEEDLSDENISSTWFAPTKIGTFVYYFNSDIFDYNYRLNLADYKLENNKLTKAKSSATCGLEANDKTKDGFIPKFMTDADKKSYIEKFPVEKEKE